MTPLLIVAACCLVQAPDPAWIDLAADWRFKPDPEHVGLRDGWLSVSYDDSEWTALDAGTRWEDQGFPELDGFAWYRRWVDVPALWGGAKAWLTLGAVNDACTVYCNGVRINSYGDESGRSVANTPIIAELSAHLKPGEANLIAIECLDWGGSGGLWQLPCAITTDPNRLPADSAIACVSQYDAKRIITTVDLSGLGNDRPDTTLRLGVFKGDKDSPAAETSLVLPADAFAATAVFDLKSPDAGDVFHVRLLAAEPGDSALAGLPIDRAVPWPEAPGWPGDYADLPVRNNFVTELLRVELDEAGGADYSILNPRNGWIFISAQTELEQGPQVVIDGENNPVQWRRNPETGAFEAMRYQSEGKHNIAVAANAKGTFEVLTVPELMYCYYPATPHIAPYGPYDWAYVSRHVLPHVNTIVTAGPEQEAFDQWRSEGRAWISNASLPGLASAQAPTVDQVYEAWRANPGVTQEGYSGMIVDEFLFAGDDYYAAWTGALERLAHDPAFEHRKFYAWCGDLYEYPSSATFQQQIAELGHRFAWEKYLPEARTPEAAASEIARNFQQDLSVWQASMPDVAQRTIMTLGYLCAPPESLNRDPAVDYHVFMDMQFHHLATEPALWGLYGIMEYSASYADEESLRWAHQLFRHYCIEGNRERLTSDPYVLPHIENPDFLYGLQGWDVVAAADGSIDTGVMEGFSWLQGRYPRVGIGDQYARMTRSGERPNRISQTIRALEPGRLYSVKAIAADLNDLGKEQSVALRIQVAEAEPVPEFCFVYAYPSNYAHTFGDFNREHPAWFTFQRYVFRATSETATLHVLDWVAEDTPGGDTGQEIGFNFIEVQPFREP
ncbi:MAG: hypothetical protein AMXMBFR82_18260 [Candidatus Hydrogenedentota bacterium]